MNFVINKNWKSWDQYFIFPNKFLRNCGSSSMPCLRCPESNAVFRFEIGSLDLIETWKYDEGVGRSGGSCTFWSETPLVLLGVKSIRSLIRVTRRCSSPSKATLVHIHWGNFLSWFWMRQRGRWRGEQCIMRISEWIAFIRPRQR